MNTFKQIFALNKKLNSVMIKNQGIVELVFYNGSKITVNVISTKTDYNFNNQSYNAEIITFTTNINQTTSYDLGTVMDVK